jgi:hypothetical protein
VCLLLVFSAVIGQEQSLNSLAIRKPAMLLFEQLAANTNRILGSIRYLQLYDVTDQKSLSLLTATVTLYEIEFKSLVVKTPALPSKLTIARVPNATLTISSAAGFELALEAQVSLKWKYHASIFDVYKGSATGVLKTSSPSLEFVFMHGKPDYKSKINFAFTLENVVTTGFGASSLVAKHIGEMFTAKMVPVLNEEVNRYNDLIVDSIVFEGFYRVMKPPVNVSKDLVLRNNLAKFYVGDVADTLDIAFSSNVYDPLKHEQSVIDAPFTPAYNASLSKSIAVTVGFEAMRKFLDGMKKGSILTDYEFNPEQLKELFGYSLNVRMLSNFYPPLLDRFDPEALVSLTCTIPKLPGMPTTFTYVCSFLMNATRLPIMKIKSLKLGAEFKVKVNPEDANNRSVAIGMQDFQYTDIDLDIRLSKALKFEFLSFLQPMAQWLGKLQTVTLDVVGPDNKWAYLGSFNTTGNFTTLYYDF